ncbi:MAG: type II secretion system GspH family protein, partial [Thermoplasmata archaeon]|nr:type II secretion system GspH family protein [Thermoplasmata archaeon]
MIESLAVLGIIGILAVLFVPSVQNSLETRTMDSMALDIRTHLHKTKFFAVKSKLNSRFRFYQNSETWTYTIEVEQSSGAWTTIPNYIDQVIPSKYTVTVNLPDNMVVFSPLGLITNFDPNQNEIIIQSPVLAQYNQPDT